MIAQQLDERSHDYHLLIEKDPLMNTTASQHGHLFPDVLGNAPIMSVLNGSCRIGNC